MEYQAHKWCNNWIILAEIEIEKEKKVFFNCFFLLCSSSTLLNVIKKLLNYKIMDENADCTSLLSIICKNEYVEVGKEGGGRRNNTFSSNFL